ncbi:peptidase S49 [Marinomonas mediterranea]|uniref:S49 family peptidase n=1 Tax=Marinomonas mediterranea TaxID=119864 RepID=UPI00234B80F7|nr:S49 family peptidase [Marinomonas mediterranea]WCN13306.1 peptidase S49 [Marinomonas mediterranea]
MSWNEEDDRKASNDMLSSEDASFSNKAQSNDMYVDVDQGTDAKADSTSKPKLTSSNNEDVASQTAVFELLKEALLENVVEKRRARRWKIFFRFVGLFLIVGIFVGWSASSVVEDAALTGDSVALIPMRGTIGAGLDIDSDEYSLLIEDAYADARTKAVVIKMNSPGGSPVHSGILYDLLMSKRKSYPDIPLIVVVSDMAASGGYYIASAADEIYADKASLVGSIGVVSPGFDASGLLESIGVERRTFTAGEDKAFLDPFSPMTPSAAQKWQSVLDSTHKQFIEAVKKGRGDRLSLERDLFTGMVFTGEQAVSYGLIDGLDYTGHVLSSRFSNLTPVYYEPREEPWKEVAKELGISFATRLSTIFSMR